MDHRHEIEVLLAESIQSASARGRSTFREISSGRTKLILLGAGRLGRTVAAKLRTSGFTILAFADNNRALWHTRIDGLDVLSPAEAAARHGADAVMIVTVWHPATHPLVPALVSQARDLGCNAVPFPVLFWAMPDQFLPYYLWDSPHKLLRAKRRVLHAYELLGDDLSRETYVRHLKLRLWGDFESLGEPTPLPQYFPGLFTLSPDECFVDCGAYDGDTLRDFVQQTAGRFRKAIAFEADAALLRPLEESVRQMGGRAECHLAAVGSRDGWIGFRGDGIGGGRADQEGAKVRCLRLDTVLEGETVSLLKMDIEGAELNAIRGSRKTIERNRPVVAACTYHQQEHLWRVPSLLNEVLPEAKIFLRAHRADGFDVVAYAVPPSRLVAPGRLPRQFPAEAAR